ncbi:hypothetical protein CPB86DRAFT_414896 [Serendipita vermifera]|nr:hypothetical protein CPB86DRAFT_414896 [Serendipita vermifera]
MDFITCAYLSPYSLVSLMVCVRCVSGRPPMAHRISNVRGPPMKLLLEIPFSHFFGGIISLLFSVNREILKLRTPFKPPRLCLYLSPYLRPPYVELTLVTSSIRHPATLAAGVAARSSLTDTPSS